MLLEGGHPQPSRDRYAAQTAHSYVASCANEEPFTAPQRKVATPLAILGFYQFSGWALVPLWIVMVFTAMAGGVVLAAFGNELFPTSYRSTAAGARVLIGTIGGGLGLLTESALYGVLGSHWDAISWMVLLALIAPLIVLRFFPETSGRELEQTAPERAA